MAASAYDLHNVDIVPFLGVTLTAPLVDWSTGSDLRGGPELCIAPEEDTDN